MKNFFRISQLDNTFPALHGLRAFFILLTAQMHVSLQFSSVIYIGDSKELTDLFRISLNSAWPAMDCFFVLSGFLIGRILLKTYEKSKGGAIRFYIRRAFRTIPLYYLTLLLLLLVVSIWPQASLSNNTKVNWIPELLLLTNYTKEEFILAPWSWSVCVEEHFYLFGPLLVLLLYKFQKPWKIFLFLIALATTALGLRYYTYALSEGYALNIFNQLFIPSHVRFDTFIWGIFAAYLSYHFPDHVKNFYSSKWAALFVWAIILSITFYLISPSFNKVPFMYLSYGGIAEDHVVRSVAKKAVFDFGFFSGILFFLLIHILIYNQSLITKILSIPFLRTLATISYGFYLVHLPIAKLVTHEFINFSPWALEFPKMYWLLCYVATCLFSYLVSYTLHLTFEKPLLKIRDKYFP